MVGPKLLSYKVCVCAFLILIYVSLLPSCAAEQNKLKIEKINIDNQIEECIEIIPNGLNKKDDFFYLNTKLKSNKSTGYCGCKSALLSYKVVAKKEGGSSILYHKDFSSLNHDDFDFLICRDSEQTYESFIIYIDCKNAD